jgi:hypothetical protein
MISHGNLTCCVYQSFIVVRETSSVYTVRYTCFRLPVLLYVFTFKPPTPNTPEKIPVHLGFLPLHHSYGLLVYGFGCLMSPSTVVVMRKWNIDLALDSIPRLTTPFHALLCTSFINDIQISGDQCRPHPFRYSPASQPSENQERKYQFVGIDRLWGGLPSSGTCDQVKSHMQR